MSRIAQRFEHLKSAGRTALIPYITAGDPQPGSTVALMHELVARGADLIELGIPFSDPMADGPVIQKATERALEHGVSLHDVLAMVREFRQQDAETPVILMGYLNPIEVLGYERFANEAAEAGVDGVLTVDLPPEEAEDYAAKLRQSGVDRVFLVSPTTPDRRLGHIAELGSGFVYYVSLKGVTGSSSLDIDDVARHLLDLRGHTTLPLGVGFGIRDPASAAGVSRIADAVVVGSAIVSRIEANLDKPEAIQSAVGDLVAAMRQAIDEAR